MSDINSNFFCVFCIDIVLCRIEQHNGNPSCDIIYCGREYRCGIYIGRGTCRFFGLRTHDSVGCALCGRVLFDVFSDAFARAAVRRIRKYDSCRFRKGGEGGARGSAFVFARAVRGNACRIGRIPAASVAARLRARLVFRAGRFAVRNARNERAQFCARPRFARLYFSARGGNLVCLSDAFGKRVRRRFVCGHERLSRASHSFGRGQGNEARRVARAVFRDPHRVGGVVRAGANRTRRGGRARSGIAAPLRNAFKRAVLRRVRACDPVLAHVFGIRIVSGLRQKDEKSDNRLPDSGAVRGVCALPFRSFPNRFPRLSRIRDIGNRVFSFLYFSRVFFPKARRENTYPRQADKESASPPSRDRDGTLARRTRSGIRVPRGTRYILP